VSSDVRQTLRDIAKAGSFDVLASEAKRVGHQVITASSNHAPRILPETGKEKEHCYAGIIGGAEWRGVEKGGNTATSARRPRRCSGACQAHTFCEAA
jgi:hypothetical protein